MTLHLEILLYAFAVYVATGGGHALLTKLVESERKAGALAPARARWHSISGVACLASRLALGAASIFFLVGLV